MRRSFARTSSLTRLPSARPAALAITADITLPISCCDCAPVSATASATSRLELLLGDLLRQVAVDQLGLGLLGRGRLVAARLAVGLGGLGAPLALALQDRDLALLVELAARLLRLLVERVEQQPQRRDPRPVALPSRPRATSAWMRSCEAHALVKGTSGASGCFAEDAVGVELDRAGGDRLARPRRHPPAGSSACSRGCSPTPASGAPLSTSTSSSVPSLRGAVTAAERLREAAQLAAAALLLLGRHRVALSRRPRCRAAARS